MLLALAFTGFGQCVPVGILVVPYMFPPHLFVDVIVMAIHIVVCIELCNLPGTIKGKER